MGSTIIKIFSGEHASEPPKTTLAQIFVGGLFCLEGGLFRARSPLRKFLRAPMHPGSLISTHYWESTHCCYNIWNINGLAIIPRLSFFNNSRKRPDSETANDRRGKRNCSKPKVIRKFNVSWQKNRS